MWVGSSLCFYSYYFIIESADWWIIALFSHISIDIGTFPGCGYCKQSCCKYPQARHCVGLRFQLCMVNFKNTIAGSCSSYRVKLIGNRFPQCLSHPTFPLWCMKGLSSSSSSLYNQTFKFHSLIVESWLHPCSETPNLTRLTPQHLTYLPSEMQVGLLGKTSGQLLNIMQLPLIKMAFQETGSQGEVSWTPEPVRRSCWL